MIEWVGQNSPRRASAISRIGFRFGPEPTWRDPLPVLSQSRMTPFRTYGQPSLPLSGRASRRRPHPSWDRRKISGQLGCGGRYLRQRPANPGRHGRTDLPFPDGRNFAGSNPDVVHEMTKLHLRKLAAVATAAGLAFYANAAIARDVWLTLNGDSASRRVVINYGHPDDRPRRSRTRFWTRSQSRHLEQ